MKTKPTLLLTRWFGAASLLVLAGISFNFPICGQSCVTPPTNQLAWWSGDGHCFDIASTNHGTPVGGVTFVGGKVGKCFSFDGTSGYVSVRGAGLQLGTGDFSIEGWEQTTATKTWNSLVSFDTYAPAIYVKGDGQLQIYPSAESTNGGFNDGQWHHFAVVRQTNAITYFKDGALAGTTTYGNAINPTTVLLGYDYDNGEQFPGLMDEVGIYNRALSAAEIAAIYNAGSAGKCKAVKVLAPPTNAIAYLGLSNAPMSVVASGAGALNYQWQHYGTNAIGQTGATLILTNAQLSDGGNYTVVATDSTTASVTSAPPALLTMANLPVTITSQPADQTVSAGYPITLTVAAYGTPPLRFQWRKSSTALAGATNATLTIPNAQMTNAGVYDVIVSNIANSVTSQVAVVSVIGASSAVFTTATQIGAGNTSYDGQDIVINGCTVTMNGSHTFHSLAVVNGGVLTHSAAATNQPDNRIVVMTTQDAYIDGASRIDVSGLGYHPGFSGPGAGASLVGTTWNDWGGGGGYGGNGADSSVPLAGGQAYGSITQPVDWGSDGGSCPSHSAVGGSGGGVIRFIVGGTLAINGQILAKGTGDSTAPGGGGDGEIGGGSGGSIWLTAATLSGHGTISADGGNADTDVDGGGGGGGRIAIYYTVNNFGGVLSACSSSISSIIGGAGTIYTKASGQTVGSVLVDNGGSFGAMTPMTSPEAFNLTIANGGQVYSLTPMFLGSLHLASNGIFTDLVGQTGVVVTVLGNAMIDPGGSFNVDSKGFPAVTGPGAGTNGNWAGGGGYGGPGGNYTGTGGGTYGSILHPTELGSGGGNDSGGDAGGNGGGAIQLVVNGTLRVDGTVSANGNPGHGAYGAGGSGGSLWLQIGTLAGSGAIQVNGGGTPSSSSDNSGGGGRLAIYYTNNIFTGLATAWPGASSRDWQHRGGCGTVYWKAASQTVGNLVLDNGGIATLALPLTAPEAFYLSVSNFAQAYMVQSVTLAGLRIATNSWLSYPAGQTGIVVSVQGNATIDAGGSLNANACGYPVGGYGGPGAAPFTYDDGGGGGYGGNGGNAYYGAAEPGGIGGYGSIVMPVDLGSSGAGSTNDGLNYCPGGGAVRLVVNGNLTVNGQLSADGSNARQNDQGGGAGGSLWLTVGGLAGTGIISANGGIGEATTDGGGGGGGRIAVYFTSNNFGGTLCARGNAGTTWGGAGTVYTKAATQTVGDVLIENGGHQGALTPFATPEAFNLYVRDGAQVYPRLGEPFTLTSLDVGAQGQITHNNGQKLNVTVLNQTIVRSNGIITANGQGYPVGNNFGPGAGINGGDTGSGGGYGGPGGTSYNSAPGGTTYGSSNAPVDWGSSGGGADGGPRSFGGGVVRLNVGGALTVDGTISANGGSAFFNGDQGNPSGGSVWLNAASLSGAGAITANGGPGNTYGGGGGGGRIAIYTPSQGFAGAITANGGHGWYWGTNGTVYFGNYVNSLAPAVLAITPSMPVAGTVSAVELTFNTAINAGTFTPADVVLTTPGGIVPVPQITVTALTPQVFRIAFPPQTADGIYTVQVGPNISSSAGPSMAGPYLGQFIIQWPRSISLTRGANALHFAWPTQLGVLYQLQSSQDLLHWNNEGGPITGSGADMTVDIPPGITGGKFYRLVLAF